MTRREIVRTMLEHKRPPYVPWSFGFTLEAREKLYEHYGTEDLDAALDNHLLWLGCPEGFYEKIGDEKVRDVFGVVWDRSVDKDIGIVCDHPLKEPTLDGYEFPDPLERR